MSGKASAWALFAALVFVVLAPFAVNAGSHKPAFGGDFTFRKIQPPKAGAKKRITIQIEPKEEPEIVLEPEKPSDAPKEMDWFWTSVGADLDASKPGRFLQALEHLAKAPSGQSPSQPRLEDLRKIADSHGRQILLHTLDKKVSPALVLALISVESSGKTNAESHKGAQGLMQLIPATAERFGVTDATDPSENIRGGVAYLDWLMREFKGDAILALAGYNAGENAVKSHKGVPPFAETRSYVPKVLAAWKVARGLCITPPELATDGCVFQTSS